MSERAAEALERMERLRRDLWTAEFEVTYREVIGRLEPPRSYEAVAPVA
jgi:hypothetical protein